MKRKNTARNALITSILSLLLCVSMLVGATFAWFTDTVESANNIIKSGNLDIVLDYWDGDSWETVEGKSDILSEDLWEPGYVDVAYLRLKNAGSLALKYQLGVNIVSETPGVNKAEQSFLLSDYIYFDVIEGVNGEAGAFADRAAAMAVATQDTKISAGYAKAATLEAGSDYLYLALVAHMPTTVGNEANHNGETVPQIDLGINVFATQADVEADSFGTDYDKFTLVNNAEELVAAVAEGGAIVLMSDIDLGETTVVIPDDKTVALDLNGHTISYTAPAEEATYHAIIVKGDLNVFGNGAIELKDNSGAAFNSGLQSTAISVQGGVLTLDEGVSVTSEAGAEMAYAVDVNTTLGESVLNVNGATLHSSYIGVRIFNNHATEKGIVNFNSGIISGARKGYDIWAQQMSHPAENAVVNVASGIPYTTTSISGTIYCFEGSAAASATELKALLAESNNVTLAADIALDNNDIITVAAGKDVTIDLNGHKLSASADKSGNQEVFLVKGNLTVKNGSMEMTALNNQEWNAMAAIFDVTAGGALKLDGVKASVAGTNMNFIVHLNNWGSAAAEITNCDFDLSYCAVRAFNSGNDMNTVTIKNTDVTGGGRLFWVHNYTAEGKDNSTLTLDIYSNDNTCENAKPVRFGFSNEVYFDLAGNAIV